MSGLRKLQPEEAAFRPRLPVRGFERPPARTRGHRLLRVRAGPGRRLRGSGELLRQELARILHETFYCERRKHGIFGSIFEIRTRMYFRPGRPRYTKSYASPITTTYLTDPFFRKGPDGAFL